MEIGAYVNHLYNFIVGSITIKVKYEDVIGGDVTHVEQSRLSRC